MGYLPSARSTDTPLDENGMVPGILLSYLPNRSCQGREKGDNTDR